MSKRVYDYFSKSEVKEFAESKTVKDFYVDTYKGIIEEIMDRGTYKGADGKVTLALVAYVNDEDELDVYDWVFSSGDATPSDIFKGEDVIIAKAEISVYNIAESWQGWGDEADENVSEDELWDEYVSQTLEEDDGLDWTYDDEGDEE